MRAAGNVVVYTYGICHCSVCAPKAMSRADVVSSANAVHPTGLDHGWEIDGAAQFKGGEPNPCPCNADADRLRYLMVC